MKKIFCFLIVFAAFMSVSARRYTVIVSLDGFRWDYPEAYNTPWLDSIGRSGIKAVMQPSFPSKTFPNHYTLATGLVPDHHGMIANKFYDKKSGRTFSLGDNATNHDPYFWHGEPIWNTAAKHGLKTGVVYWPGSDVKIQGRFPTYYKDYACKPLLTFAQRIAEVERLLSLPEADRPALVMAYFEEPDHNGHLFGPMNKQTRARVEEMDALIGQMWNDLKRLPIGDSINFIVTADHGMTPLSPERVIVPSHYLKCEWYSYLAPDLPTLIEPVKGYEDSICNALAAVPHLRVWKKSQVPAYLKYGSNDNIMQIVALPDMGWIVTENPRRVLGGTHGFDPTGSDMHVIFRAAGPDFKKGYVKALTFANTDVYPLLCRLLGIAPATNDGNLREVDDLLRRN